MTTWTGPDDERMIASDTDPWVEVNGTPVDWIDWMTSGTDPVDPTNTCEGCEGAIVPGAIEAMNTPQGIERCDTCQRFEGDLFAAAALAALVNGTVHFEEEAPDG